MSMNDQMSTLVYISLLAVYQQRGIVHAIAYGVSQGMTTEEVYSIINFYDAQAENAKQGLLP
jgi:hypothetical protein